MFFTRQTLTGPTTGSFVAERPITDIVKECLTDAMERAGYKMLDSANQLSITTEIQDFDIKLAMGAWSNEAISTLTMKFIIKETTDGKTIWRDTILGKGHAKPKGFDYGQVYSVECFTSSLDDAIRQFVENEEVVDLVK